MTARVVGLHHAGVYVSDLEHSLEFYRSEFGLEVVERLAFGDEQLAFLRAGPVRLELIQGPVPGRRPTGVVDHVAFEVHDLESLLSELRARGVRLLDASPVLVPELNARIAFCLGPDDERIELFEYL